MLGSNRLCKLRRARKSELWTNTKTRKEYHKNSSVISAKQKVEFSTYTTSTSKHSPSSPEVILVCDSSEIPSGAASSAVTEQSDSVVVVVPSPVLEKTQEPHKITLCPTAATTTAATTAAITTTATITTAPSSDIAQASSAAAAISPVGSTDNYYSAFSSVFSSAFSSAVTAAISRVAPTTDISSQNSLVSTCADVTSSAATAATPLVPSVPSIPAEIARGLDPEIVQHILSGYDIKTVVAPPAPFVDSSQPTAILCYVYPLGKYNKESLLRRKIHDGSLSSQVYCCYNSLKGGLNPTFDHSFILHLHTRAEELTRRSVVIVHVDVTRKCSPLYAHLRQDVVVKQWRRVIYCRPSQRRNFVFGSDPFTIDLAANSKAGYKNQFQVNFNYLCSEDFALGRTPSFQSLGTLVVETDFFCTRGEDYSIGKQFLSPGEPIFLNSFSK
jgi:hypothetical protein